MSRATMLVALFAALAACGDDDGGGTPDSGGGAMDSGGGADSGGATDSGGGADSGGATDSGAGDDAGRVPDAGRAPDAAMCAAMGTDGCALSGGTACCAGLMCCAGVPLPEEGRCIGGGGGCPMSDRNIKHGFATVDPEAILAGVATLPISTWSYDDQPGVRHMGPMAQDFAAAFAVGEDDRHINVIDMNGVSTAAIQALHARTEALAAQNEALRRDNAALREAIGRIERRLGP